MFGLGKKKEKEVVRDDAAHEQPKVPVYDINTEVVFHIMPTRFKKQNIDAKQAQKTGMAIMIIAFIFIFLLIATLVWYFLFNSKKTALKSEPVAEIMAENTAATSTAQPVVHDFPVETPVNSQVVTPPVVVELATATPVVSTTSMATSSSPIVGEGAQTFVVASSTDTDSDGLTNEEEILLGTNKEKSDTDGDGFSDLAELEKGYNPLGAGKLAQIKAFGKYDNTNFSLFYPSTWQFTANGNDSVVFRTGDDQMIQVSLQPNIKNQTIASWYKEQFGNKEISNDQYINQVDSEGNALWQGIFSPNGLTAYLTNDKKQTIVSINYDLGFSSKLNYRQLFLTMINSFIMKN